VSGFARPVVVTRPRHEPRRYQRAAVADPSAEFLAAGGTSDSQRSGHNLLASPRHLQPLQRHQAQQAIRDLTRAMSDRTGNTPPLPGMFPDYPATIVRNQPDGRELTTARWGMPTPPEYLIDHKGQPRKSDSGVTNVRNTPSKHWRPWLGVENRCVVPFTSFAEHEELPDGSRSPIWFALDESRPLACFAGIWTRWTSVRKVKEGETTNDILAFLTTRPTPSSMPIIPRPCRLILTTQEEIDIWMTAPPAEALKLQRPLADDALIVVARGEKQDPPASSETRGSERAQSVDVAPGPTTQPTFWDAAPEE
jgi:putative SOS response-associated peptidase YedK